MVMTDATNVVRVTGQDDSPTLFARGEGEGLSRDEMTWLLRSAIEKSDEVRKYRDYYAGKQPDALTDDQKTMLEGLIGSTESAEDDWDTDVSSQGGSGFLCDNVCKIIVDIPTSRLLVERFACEDDNVVEATNEVAVINGLDSMQNDVHTHSLRDGDSYVLMEYDLEKKRVYLYSEMQWVAEEGSDTLGHGMHVVYSGMGRPLLAIKEWVEDVGPGVSIRRRNVYYPGRIERYGINLAVVGGDGAGLEWEGVILPEDQGQWPVITTINGQEIGLPVVHFPNGTDGTPYGVSELAGDVIGKQRSRNDMMHAILAATRMHGYPIFTATGVSEGETSNWKAGPGQIWGTSTEGAKVSSIPPGDITSLLEALAANLRSISNTTGLPPHYLSGQFPSGEALIRSEMPLVSKASRKQSQLGQPWASMMHKATVLMNAFGNAGLNEDALITTLWHDASLRDEKYQIEVVTMKSQFLSDEEVLRELGYDEEQITKIIAERVAKDEADMKRAQALATPIAP